MATDLLRDAGVPVQGEGASDSQRAPSVVGGGGRRGGGGDICTGRVATTV